MAKLGRFVTLMIAEKVKSLKSLRAALAKYEVEDIASFHDVMIAAFRYGGLKYTELADDLGYTPSTTWRWIEEQSTPHPSLWPTIITWVKEGLSNEITYYNELLGKQR